MKCVCARVFINTTEISFTAADKKEILKNVNGRFRSCELTGVLGQSGSGKTTLLNILSGYTKNIDSGRITIGDGEYHGIQRSSKYIMQNYNLHRYITVREAMIFAANLKMHGVSDTCRTYKVRVLSKLIALLQRV
jgi:ABC-type multidrug transport system ATPase subunit